MSHLRCSRSRGDVTSTAAKSTAPSRTRQTGHLRRSARKQLLSSLVLSRLILRNVLARATCVTPCASDPAVRCTRYRYFNPFMARGTSHLRHGYGNRERATPRRSSVISPRRASRRGSPAPVVPAASLQCRRRADVLVWPGDSPRPAGPQSSAACLGRSPCPLVAGWPAGQRVERAQMP